MVIEGITYLSINLSKEVGIDDSLLAVRIVPDGEEGKTIYARTLRPDEVDDGRSIMVNREKGETLKFRSGSIEISIRDIDKHAKTGADGYAPISNTLWTWLIIGPSVSQSGFLHTLAAGRRLDAAHILLTDVSDRRISISGSFTKQRAEAIDALALAEILMIAVERAADLCERLKTEFKVKINLPNKLTANRKALREIRNAFEHIEDRAKGQVRGKPHRDAFSVFQQKDFLSQGRIAYGNYILDLEKDILPLLSDLREFLFQVAVEFAGPSKKLNPPIEFFNPRMESSD